MMSMVNKIETERPDQEHGQLLRHEKQPLFFAGQLLTAEDLSALTDWMDARLRRLRSRDGWGVVCGLDVHCDPRHKTRVVVAPGLAVDAWGREIVVACEDTTLDLKKVCSQLAPSCDAPNSDVKEKWVEICIKYVEEETDRKPVLDKCQNGRHEKRPSRRLESYKLFHRDMQPDKMGWVAWKDSWKASFAGIPGGSDGKYLSGELQQLSEYLQVTPLRYFCQITHQVDTSLKNGLKAAQRQEGESPSAKPINGSRWLFYIHLDRILTFLAETCEIAVGDCVPLARVCVAWEKGSSTCRVAAVDTRWTGRRSLRVDSLPAPPGKHNLAPLLWLDWSELDAGRFPQYADLLCQVDTESDLTGVGWKDALKLLCRPPVSACGHSPQVQVVEVEACSEVGMKDVGKVKRIVGFGPVPIQIPIEKLQDIKGIGPQAVKSLREAGIETIEEFLKESDDDLKSILKQVLVGKFDLEQIRKEASKL